MKLEKRGMLNLKFVRGIRAGLLAVVSAVAGGAVAEDLKIQTTELPDGKVQEAYTATLTATGWCADGGTWEVPLPFDFPFCGKTYRTAYINENGLVDFNKAVSGTRTYPQWDNVGLTAFGNRDLHTGVWAATSM